MVTSHLIEGITSGEIVKELSKYYKTGLCYWQETEDVFQSYNMHGKKTEIVAEGGGTTRVLQGLCGLMDNS